MAESIYNVYKVTEVGTGYIYIQNLRKLKLIVTSIRKTKQNKYTVTQHTVKL